jgi:hypothetical protein
MRPHEEDSTRELLDAFEWHPVTEATAEEAGRLGRRWLASHRGIDTADLLIAATARILNRTVLTRNVRHFPMFPDLSSRTERARPAVAPALWGPHGVRVCGTVLEMIAGMAALRRAPQTGRRRRGAAFLASDRAAGMTGTMTNVTRGLVLR